jgi:translation initiation factor 2 beta subunit (eIF-2beta)/eIF-5
MKPGVAMMIAITSDKTDTAGNLDGRRSVIIVMMMMIVLIARLMRMHVARHVIMKISAKPARNDAEGERERAQNCNQTSSNAVWKQPDVCNAQTHRAKTPVGNKN